MPMVIQFIHGQWKSLNLKLLYGIQGYRRGPRPLLLYYAFSYQPHKLSHLVLNSCVSLYINYSSYLQKGKTYTYLFYRNMKGQNFNGIPTEVKLTQCPSVTCYWGPHDGPSIRVDLHFQRTGPNSYVSILSTFII